MKQLPLRIALLCFAALLVGCSMEPADVSGQAQNAAINASLNSAAQSTAVSLAQLSAIEKAQHPTSDGLPFPNVNDPALNQLIFARWYGPVEPLLSMIAVKVGYQLQVYGKPPSLPILVDIDDANNLVPAIDIIRNIDLQAGLRATLQIYPEQKIISLRYL